MKTETFTETSAISVEDARIAIAQIRQNVALMGANDSEFFMLDQVLKKLDSNEFEPSEAVHEAQSILSGKQDYH